VPDWSGKLWCLDAVTGTTIWKQTIYDLVLQVDPTPLPPASPGTVISRTSPAISGNYLVGSNCLRHVLHSCLDCMNCMMLFGLALESRNALHMGVAAWLSPFPAIASLMGTVD
jgi:hypothetical protein